MCFLILTVKGSWVFFSLGFKDFKDAFLLFDAMKVWLGKIMCLKVMCCILFNQGLSRFTMCLKVMFVIFFNEGLTRFKFCLKVMFVNLYNKVWLGLTCF